jgi:hypothetical protein
MFNMRIVVIFMMCIICSVHGKDTSVNDKGTFLRVSTHGKDPRSEILPGKDESTVFAYNLQAAYFTPEVFASGDYNDIFMDSSGNGNTLSLSNGQGSQPGANFDDPSQGFVDFAANFNDGVQANGFADYEWGPEWGFSFWFKRTSAVAVDQALMGNMDAQYNGAWSFYIEDVTYSDGDFATCGFAFSTDHNESGGRHVRKFKGLQCDDGVWHNYVMTGNGNWVNVYLDNEGVFVQGPDENTYDIVAEGNLATSASPIYIGGSINGAPAFQGDMKDIFLYKQFLSKDDVRSIYDQTTVPTEPPSTSPTLAPVSNPTKPPSVDASNIVASWFTPEIIQGDLPIVMDYSAHGHDLSLVNIDEELPVPSVEQLGVSFATGNNGGLQSANLGGFPWGREWGFQFWFKLPEENIGDSYYALFGNMVSQPEMAGTIAVFLQGKDGKPNISFAFNTDEEAPNSNHIQSFDNLEMPVDTLLDWHMLTLTGNGEYVNMYFDNEIVYFLDSRTYNQPAVGSLVNTYHPIWIAGTVLDKGDFTGEMRDVKIYNKFLSANDVDNDWAVYHTRSPTEAPTGAPTAPTNKPTPNPTNLPPTEAPASRMPTSIYYMVPTGQPTEENEKSLQPTFGAPTEQPTLIPTAFPTVKPTAPKGGTISSADQAGLASKDRNIIIIVTIVLLVIILLVWWLRRSKPSGGLADADTSNLSPYDKWQLNEEAKAAGIASPIQHSYKEDSGDTVITIESDGRLDEHGFPIRAGGGLNDAKHKSVKHLVSKDADGNVIVKDLIPRDASMAAKDDDDEYSHYGCTSSNIAGAMADHIDNSGSMNPLQGNMSTGTGENPMKHIKKASLGGGKGSTLDRSHPKKTLQTKKSFKLDGPKEEL